MIRNMVVGSIGFIGIGEGGCNIVNKFESLGYKKVFYINSAMKDLSKLNKADSSSIYHIPNESGCVRDRTKAKQLLKDNYDIILNNIQQKLGNLKIIFVVFSMGGGTGSGMSPLLLSGLINRMPNTKFNTISIVPDAFSSAKMKYNACECYSEIKKIKNHLGNSYFINNDNIRQNDKYIAKIDVMDNSFVSKLNDVINVSDSNGSVDEAEILTLLSTNGNTLIYEILPEHDIIKDRLSLDISLTEVESGCEYLLYSILNDSHYIKDIVEEKVGVPMDKFIAYNEEADFIVSFGMKFPDKLFSKLRSECEDIMCARENVEDNNEFELNDLNNIFKPKLSKTIIDKSIKNSKDLLDELADF